MNSTNQRLCAIAQTLAVLSCVLWAWCSTNLAACAANAEDEIILINTRAIGTLCDSDVLENRLLSERYSTDLEGKSRWESSDWHDFVAGPAAKRPTIVYIHGNRIARGMDRAQGLQVYHSLLCHGRPNEPVRFVIWSWPAAHISGPVKDYKVKAFRTRPAGWQLAWFLDQLPARTPVALVGYSYGARIASGALHVLGGGSLGGLKLDHRVHPQRQPIRVALVAAAFDADWIQPGHFHGRAISQVDRLMLMTNRLDPAMRFYHLSNGRGRVHALGKEGMTRPQALSWAKRQRVQRLDFTPDVGRSHSLSDYLAVSGKIERVWRQLLKPDVY